MTSNKTFFITTGFWKTRPPSVDIGGTIGYNAHPFGKQGDLNEKNNTTGGDFCRDPCRPPVSAAEEGKWGAGVHGGTLGLGANASYHFSDSLRARGMFNQFDYDYEETESGNKYEGDLELQSFGLLLDWYPFDSGFRLSGGAFLNNNKVSARTQGTADIDINGRDYSVQLNAQLEFDNFAPYLGVGWNSGVGERGLRFSIDAGALYQNTPELSVSGRATAPGGNCTFTVSANSRAQLTGGDACNNLDANQGRAAELLRLDLESEHRELTGNFDDFKWYPVLFIGVSYYF